MKLEYPKNQVIPHFVCLTSEHKDLTESLDLDILYHPLARTFESALHKFADKELSTEERERERES